MEMQFNTKVINEVVLVAGTRKQRKCRGGLNYWFGVNLSSNANLDLDLDL